MTRIVAERAECSRPGRSRSSSRLKPEGAIGRAEDTRTNMRTRAGRVAFHGETVARYFLRARFAAAGVDGAAAPADAGSSAIACRSSAWLTVAVPNLPTTTPAAWFAIIAASGSGAPAAR